MVSITSFIGRIFVGVVLVACSANFAQSVIVKKEKMPSAAVLNQEASELVGDILKTSAELVKNLGELQSSCLASLERVVNGEGTVTKTKLSTVELKKCVEELRSHKDSLEKLKEEVSSSCAFCSARF
jgi:hypothetical protein